MRVSSQGGTGTGTACLVSDFEVELSAIALLVKLKIVRKVRRTATQGMCYTSTTVSLVGPSACRLNRSEITWSDGEIKSTALTLSLWWHGRVTFFFDCARVNFCANLT